MHISNLLCAGSCGREYPQLSLDQPRLAPSAWRKYAGNRTTRSLRKLRIPKPFCRAGHAPRSAWLCDASCFSATEISTANPHSSGAPESLGSHQLGLARAARRPTCPFGWRVFHVPDSHRHCEGRSSRPGAFPDSALSAPGRASPCTSQQE